MEERKIGKKRGRPKISRNKTLEKRNLSRRHNKDKKRVNCPFCNKIVKGKKYLVVHCRAHGNDLRVELDKSNNERKKMKLLKIKSKERKKETFPCKICKINFSSKDYLLMHINRKHREKSVEKPKEYKCEKCQEILIGEAENKSHMKIHETIEKIFEMEC